MTTPQPPGFTGPEPAPQPPGYQQPSQALSQPTPQPPGPKRRSNVLTSRPVIGLGALLIGVALGSGVGGNHASAGSAAAPTVTVTATQSAAAAPADEPTKDDAQEPAVEPTDEPTQEASEPAPEPKKDNYKTLSSRGFKLLAKDPDASFGKTYVIYGEITQFDSATGNDAFRANTGPRKLPISWGFTDYEQNTVLNGSESKLRKLVEGDCFKAKVTVLGSYSYDTQIGGSTTVPLLEVDAISVYGSTD